LIARSGANLKARAILIDDPIALERQDIERNVRREGAKIPLEVVGEGERARWTQIEDAGN
jgi:hypothetical protein